MSLNVAAKIIEPPTDFPKDLMERNNVMGPVRNTLLSGVWNPAD
jgi:hypothetical protein